MFVIGRLNQSLIKIDKGTKNMSKVFKSQLGLASIIIALIIAGVILLGIGTVYFYQQLKVEEIKVEEKPEITPPPTIQPESPKTQPEPPKIGIIEYPNASIFYGYDGQVWQFNPKSEVKNKIANGSCPKVSPDKTKIAYTYHGWHGWDESLKPSEANLTGIHIFDIATGEDKLLKYYDEHYYPAGAESWSPDGKYLVEDEGTSPVRGKTVIDSNTGKEIISFTTYGKSYAWINDKEIVFTDLQYIAELRPYGEGYGAGIAIINLNSQERVLKTAADKKDYHFIQLLDNKIYFSLTTVESNEGWSDKTKQTVSYWTMDKFGGNLIQVEKIESLEDKIKKLLPSPYSEYKSLWYATPLTDNKNWTVFILNKAGETILESEIFIMDIDNPESIKKIGNGICPGW